MDLISNHTLNNIYFITSTNQLDRSSSFSSGLDSPVQQLIQAVDGVQAVIAFGKHLGFEVL